MPQSIVQVALLVREYEEALAYYCGVLGFELIADTPIPEQHKRWVLIRPPGAVGGCALLLARASTPEQLACVGHQSGGRVFLFLQTDDVWRDYRAMLDRGVRFVRPPSEQAYGTVAVFEDLYGNRWDLLHYHAEAGQGAAG